VRQAHSVKPIRGARSRRDALCRGLERHDVHGVPVPSRWLLRANDLLSTEPLPTPQGGRWLNGCESLRSAPTEHMEIAARLVKW
jgi:hypothetical protein